PRHQEEQRPDAVLDAQVVGVDGICAILQSRFAGKANIAPMVPHLNPKGVGMTILVTGARGNIGSRVIARLAEAGHAVRGSARHATGLTLPAGVEAVELDVTRADYAAQALRDV